MTDPSELLGDIYDRCVWAMTIVDDPNVSGSLTYDVCASTIEHIVAAIHHLKGTTT